MARVGPFRFGDRAALKILLYEHVSSGGYAGEPIPASLLSEGYAMLRGLTTDFKAAGHEVTVLLDARIAAFHPPLNADHIVQIGVFEEADPSMEQAAENAEAAYLIAPEPSQILQSIVECIESTGALSLNCQSVGIQQASDKANLWKRAESLGLHSPKTKTFSITESSVKSRSEISAQLGFPVIVKPANGAGCSGLSVAQNETEVVGSFGKIKKETTTDQVAVQEFISGVPASVAVICDGTKALPVSLNLQKLTLSGPGAASSYEGGQVPLGHVLKEAAFFAAKHVVESFEGLRGYVGVDLVLSDDKVFVIEVNPRLTTSYVGLRKVSSFNVAQAIFDAVVKNKLPESPTQRGVCCFSKVSLNCPEALAWRRLCGLDWVVAPPFPLCENDSSYGLVQSCGKTTQESGAGLAEAKKRLQHMSTGAD